MQCNFKKIIKICTFVAKNVQINLVGKNFTKTKRYVHVSQDFENNKICCLATNHKNVVATDCNVIPLFPKRYKILVHS